MCRRSGGAWRWTLHFTSTSAAWLSAVEGFVEKLSRRPFKFTIDE